MFFNAVIFIYSLSSIFIFFFFFFNDTATTEIYTLSLHDALPIYREAGREHRRCETRPVHPAHDGVGLKPSRSVARTVRLAISSLVPSLTRQTRALVAIAAGSFLAIVLAYLLAPADRRALVAGVSWTWAMVYAIACSAVAARRHPSPDQRRAWVWIGAGCVLFLAGQLVWSYYELIRRVMRPYPSLADVGFLG